MVQVRERILVLERATNEVETVRIVVERAEVAQDYYSLYHQSKVELEASAKQVELLKLEVKELENQLLSKRKQPPFSSESQSQKETQKPRGSLGIDEILSDFCTSINDKCTTMKGTKRIINSLI
jgi:lysyl-tRNA synthetase class I